MFDKLKYRLAITFSVMSVLGIGIAIIGYYYFQKIDDIYQLTKSTNNAFGYYLQMKESEHDFLWKDNVDESFFTQNNSPSTIKFNEYLILTMDKLNAIREMSSSSNILLKEEIESLKDLMYGYDSLYKKMTTLYKERGGENHGYVGKMREYALFLETHNYVFNKENLLLIKRHERDYILLRDSVYLKSFKDAVNGFYLDLLENNKLKTEEILELQNIFNKYNQSFKNLVLVEKEIGLIGNGGLLDKIDIQKKLIEASFDRIYIRVNENEKNTISQLYAQFSIIAGLLVLIGITFSIFIANRLISPLQRLQKHMHTVVQNNFKNPERINCKENDEISTLISSFNMLLDKLEESMATISQKNLQLEERNNKLEKSELDLKKNVDLRDKFLAILSHDMRSPINTLSGFVNLLKNFSQNISPQEIQEFAQNMEITLDGVKELLDNLLQWAKLQTDTFIVKKEKINIQHVLENNIKLVNHLIIAKNIHINFLLIPGTVLETDNNVLNFVLRNVLQNAIKFTNYNGKIEIRVILGSEETTFLVRDNGVGMNSEQLRKLFDHKTHFTKEGTSKEKGAGLGLLLCKEFMEKLGGEIYVDSEVNVGTTFYVKFPKEEVNA
ncbi:MAG: HAMP domain-containing sensor histidine kinase [Cytophagales bacterium]